MSNIILNQGGDIMESYQEKRQYKRYGYQTSMYLYQNDNQEQYYYAEMKDYGQGGQCLLSDKEMEVGQKVYLEMKNYDQYAAGPEKYKSYEGYIKWGMPYSSNYSDSDGKTYRYGIEYYQPAYY